MNPKTYFKLTTSTDVEVIGRIYAQFNSHQISGFVDPENTDHARRSSYQECFGDIDKTLDLHKFKTHPRARMTDLMSSDFFWRRCFYSPRFVKLFANFIGEQVELIDCTVHHRGRAHGWHLMQIRPSLAVVDFERSEFGLYDAMRSHYVGPVTQTVTAQTFWDVFRHVSADTDNAVRLKARRVVLNTPCDLFHLDLDNGYYISERLRESIEAAGLTGFEFDPIPKTLQFLGDW